MEKRVLGRTALEVTQLSFGAMELRFEPDDERRTCTDEQAEKVLNAVLDAGINFIDTSPDYGLSEERIGRFVSGRRSEYYLATKCGCDPADKGGQGGHIWNADQLHKNIAASLERLKTDHVDMLQLHNPKIEEVDVDELFCQATIVGTKSVEHLAANVAAAERGPLPAELYAEVDRRVQTALAEIGPS